MSTEQTNTLNILLTKTSACMFAVYGTLSLAHSIQWSMTAGNDFSVQYGTSSSTGSLFNNIPNNSMPCTYSLIHYSNAMTSTGKQLHSNKSEQHTGKSV